MEQKLNDTTWIDLNDNEYKYVMDIAKYHNLDHLIHNLRREFGYYIKMKEKVLVGLMIRIQGTDDFCMTIRDKMQRCGIESFGWT